MKRATPWEEDSNRVREDLARAIGYAVGRALGQGMPPQALANDLTSFAFVAQPGLRRDDRSPALVGFEFTGVLIEIYADQGRMVVERAPEPQSETPEVQP